MFRKDGFISVNNTIRSSNFNIHIVIWGDGFTYRLPPDISISLDSVEIGFRYLLIKCSERTGLYQSIIQYEALTSIFT